MQEELTLPEHRKVPFAFVPAPSEARPSRSLARIKFPYHLNALCHKVLVRRGARLRNRSLKAANAMYSNPLGHAPNAKLVPVWTLVQAERAAKGKSAPTGR